MEDRIAPDSHATQLEELASATVAYAVTGRTRTAPSTDEREDAG